MWIAASVEVDHKLPDLVLRVFDLAGNLRALCDQAGKDVGISKKILLRTVTNCSPGRFPVSGGVLLASP
jgi:hypothetical protein